MINRHTLHSLLRSFPPAKTFGLFTFKTSIRKIIEDIRGDLEQHREEEYRRMYINLNDDEIELLINGLYDFINASSSISDLDSIDNKMIHRFMTQCLIQYELDENIIDDPFREILDAYYSRLFNEIADNEANLENLEIHTSLDVFLFHLIKYPEYYITHLFIEGMGNDYKLGALNLSECGCKDISHDRLLSDVRFTIQNRILDHCRIVSQNEQPLRILSLGTGEGLQVFIIILKLFQMGIRNIELTLVEPKYKDIIDPEISSIRYYKKDWNEGDPLPERYYSGSTQRKFYSIIRALSLLSKSFTDSNLAIYQYPFVSYLQEEKTFGNHYDVVYAVDLDEYAIENSSARADFHKLANYLSENGRAFVSSHYKIEEFEKKTIDSGSIFNLINTVKFQTPERVNDLYYENIHSMKNFFS